MIEEPETVNDVEDTQVLRLERLRIGGMRFDVWMATFQLGDVLGPAVDCDHRASTIEVEANEVTHSGSHVEHPTAGDRKIRACKPLETRRIDRARRIRIKHDGSATAIGHGLGLDVSRCNRDWIGSPSAIEHF